MPAFVLDSSVAIAWLMPDEGGMATDRLLDRVVNDGALAPSLWLLEVGNTLLVATRRNRMSMDQRREALSRLGGLPIELDLDTSPHAWGSSLDLADRYGLTLYDATYLEVASRRRLPLATLDAGLATAARSHGLETLGARP